MAESPESAGRKHVSDVQVFNRTVREAIWERDSYGLLLLMLIVDYIILASVNSSRWAGLIRLLPIALTLLLAMHTSGASRRLVRLAQVTVVIAVAGGIFQGVTDQRYNGAISAFLFSVLMAFMPVVILRRILRHREVTLETLMGAVCVYISIGLFFAALFVGMAHIETNPPFLAQHPPDIRPASDYVYLSFVTLTTVGFGDLTPLANAARMVVVLEALIGQIFLVTLVARLVALYSTADRGDRSSTRAVVEGDQDPAPPGDRRLAGWFTRVRPRPSDLAPEPGGGDDGD